MSTEPNSIIPQAATLPYYVDEQGRLHVLLTRRNDHARWGIPKGVVDPGHSLEDAARLESLEEAGVEGTLSDEPIGTFSYPKWGGVCRVAVFALRVDVEHPTYDEKLYRERQWFEWESAVELPMREPVREMLRRLPQHLVCS